MSRVYETIYCITSVKYAYEPSAGNSISTATSTTIGKMPDGTMVRKRMELRVAYMECMRQKGNEDVLATVSLSVADLRSWLMQVEDVRQTDRHKERSDASVSKSIDPKNATLVLRHLQVMILNRVPTCECVFESAAHTAVVLYDYDLHSLVDTLLQRYGEESNSSQTQLWRMLLIVVGMQFVFAVGFYFYSTNYDELLYHETIFDSTGAAVRLADLINDGLASSISGCRIEAVRVLHSCLLHLHRDTVVRVLEILLDTAEEEANDEAEQFIVAVVWEIVFLHAETVTGVFAMADLDTENALLSRLQSSCAMVRRVSIHGALRLIAHAQSVSQVELDLLCHVVQIYASGTEEDPLCQQLMFNFFEECLGDSQSHLVKLALRQINRQAYLTGVPLPAFRNLASSQSDQRPIFTKDESVLYRQNKLLMAPLNENDRQEVIMEICRMLSDEFSTVYTAERIAEILGAPVKRN